MAGRPPKEGIDYSGWAVDIFDSDPKIDKLLDAQGAAGFLVYFYLCQRAYGSKGYFYAWSYDDAATTARKIGGGVGSEAVRQTVGLCLQIGLFDKRLFDRDGILTSRGIQKRFWQVAKDRTCNIINPDQWLLENVGLINNHTPNTDYEGSKSNYAAPKVNYQNQKESKVKQSKEKVEERAGTRETCDGFEVSTQELEAHRKALDEIEDACKSVGMPFNSQYDLNTASELVGAYPVEWIVQAIQRAKDREKPSWGYIKAILERWKAKGGIDDAKVPGKTQGTSRPSREVAEHRYGQRVYSDDDLDALVLDLFPERKGQTVTK